MQFIALSASLVIAVQIIYSLVNGSTLCPNEGCELVERLTAISPLYFNILGLLYFQFVYWSFRFFKGEDKILNYVRHACFNPQPVLYFDQSFQAGEEEMTVLTEDGGECTLDIDCNDQ